MIQNISYVFNILVPFLSLMYYPLAVFCENVNEQAGSIKGGEVYGWLSDY
jgi:hypothetical protein